MSRATTIAWITLLLPGLALAQTPQRPKIYGLAFVRVKASDFQKTSETYRKILGLGTGTNGCVKVKNPCFVVNANQHIELTQAAPGEAGTWLDQIAFRTNNVGGMREYLLAQGVQVSDILSTPDGMPLVETSDPEGNRIAFVQFPPVDNDAPARFHAGPNQVSSRIFHAGFVVHDLTLMKHFYLDELGFRLYWKGGFKDLPPGAPEKDSDIDWFEIQVPNGSDWVEFMLNIPANA